jgi:hypothetical protein
MSVQSRFAREKFFPKSRQEAMGRFLALFHRYGWIYKPIAGGGWISANEKWSLTDTEILKAIACVHPKFFLGARPGKATRFGVLDIDAGSKYHNVKQLGVIVDTLAKAGIQETSLYRSSESGGWHLYLFFDEPISSRDLRAQLVQLLRLSGFEIAKGTLEVFPAPGEGSRANSSLGNGLRLPLQPGFAWLNHQGQVVEERDCISPVEALDQFLKDMDCCNSRHDFHQMKAHVARMLESQEQITAKVGQIEKKEGIVLPFNRSKVVETDKSAEAVVTEVFQGLPPGINAGSWVQGREFSQSGLTGQSQRAEAIFCLSHYFFYGDPERGLLPLGYGYEKERQWAIETILTTRHNGNSKDINRGRGDAIAQVERAAAWVPKERRGEEVVPFVKRVPIAWQRNSANLKSQAVKKIEAAVADFEEANMVFSVRDLALKSGVSSKTLYKHAQLWKPAQEQLQQVRLAGVLPEYNAVVGAGSSETKPPTAVLPKIVPPGLLAARRVAYEISMRAQKDIRQKEKSFSKFFDSAEIEWKDKVSSLTKDRPGDLSEPRLRSLLVVLSHFLSLAPCEEEAKALQSYILGVREELAQRSQGFEVSSCGTNVGIANS